MEGPFGLIEFLWLFTFSNLFIQCSFREINLPQGKVRGIRSYVDDYRAYLGIPYASVIERFQDPGPAPKWKKTFNAVRGSVQCTQADLTSGETIGQEDCLVLNVFTPVTFRKQPLKVLVFIHGGGFYSGSNSDVIYNPKYLVKKDIIVVTINYRLGAFGFLCLQIPQAPGNTGLKDQVAAIRWVKSNIRYFGGDPNSITLFGQSVGASSISYLLLSPETEGLFQHVILASGSLLVPYALDNDPINSASRIAARMGYKTDDPIQLLNIYKNASANDIAKASYFDDTNDPLALYVFRPCIDKSEGSLVKDGPRKIIKPTLIERNVTIVMGYNNMEGIKWAEKYNAKGLEDLNSDFSKIIPYNIIFADDEEKSTFVREVKEFYFNNQTIGLNSYDPLINYFSDSIILYAMTAMAKYFLRTEVALYFYYFQYDSSRNYNKLMTKLASKPGASHGDDLFYAFDPLIYRPDPLTPNDAAVINAVTSFWSNVVKIGNPSTDNIEWISSTRDNVALLTIDKTFNMISLPNIERLRFWKAIYAKYKSY